jgi:hypothetical protein
MSIIQEYIYDLVRGIGDAYNLIYQGVGDVNTPGTAIFELEQVNSIAVNGLPYFGILDVPNGFLVTPTQASTSGEPTSNDLLSRQVTINRGQVGFKGQIINIPKQNVAIANNFSMQYYEDSDQTNAHRYYYGVLIGLDYSELLKTSTILNTVTTSVVASSQNYIQVQDVSGVLNLGFPIKAIINNVVVEFSNGDFNSNTLFVSPSSPSFNTTDNIVNYGIVGSNFPPQTRLTFVYEPKFSVLFDAPILSNPDVSTYNPVIPSSLLPVAKIIVADPNHPRLVTGNNYQIQNIQNVYPLITGLSQAEITSIVNSYNSLKKSIKDAVTYTSVSTLIQSLVSYTSSVSGSGLGFAQYWANQPFEATGYYNPGVSFLGLQRFEFPTLFSKAYYSIYKKDTMHTLGIFRGDMITRQQSNSTATPPANIVVNTGTLPNGALTIGTIIYNISSIDSNGLEGAPIVKIITPSVGNSLYIANEISWDLTSGNTYHIYRRSNTVGNIENIRLTPDGGLAYIAKPALPSCSPNTTYTLSNNIMLLHITSEGNLIGGISVPLTPVDSGSLATLLQLNDGIKAYYWGTSASATNIPTNQSTSTFPFSNLSTNVSVPTECFMYFSEPIELPPGDHYIALYIPNDALNLLKINQQSSGSGNLSFANTITYGLDLLGNTDYSLPLTTSSFTNLGGSLNATVYGFVDYGQPGTLISSEGVYITDNITNVPSRLLINVPLLNLTSDGLGTPFISNGTTQTSTAIDNDIVVSVYARNTKNGKSTILNTTIPQGTLRGTKTLLGNSKDLYDTVDYMYVQVGNNFNKTSNNRILWTINDLITVENVI